MARDRINRVKVALSEDERAKVAANAKASGLTMSAYLRQVGLGYHVRSVLDHEHVLEVRRARADLGRLGGLLKLWLTDREGEGARVDDVRAVLHQIEDAAAEVQAKVRTL